MNPPRNGVHETGEAGRAGGEERGCGEKPGRGARLKQLHTTAHTGRWKSDREGAVLSLPAVVTTETGAVAEPNCSERNQGSFLVVLGTPSLSRLHLPLTLPTHIHKSTITPTINTAGQRPLGWCHWHHFRCTSNFNGDCVKGTDELGTDRFSLAFR